ncbi:Putative Hdr-like menaquinol oxidoreductase integral membrane subunit (HmeB/DsrP) [Magnetospirillum sp. XM-1]|uniref:NrfD/PsrC family molybdoenzyme membrane anchor subunit n=1 Tax=Magnetospirillum sp. XM-1 TaxID=1663591 RepID=UPI00073DBFD0|nr:NrfD/PsrC family molybdoenzyme membrane anchor subunit [Magnetospirillum sp. XM-1]CUW41314.1 Putative Hdr-like menaquinol oxidoreductase integral membrane subunit (HmeB/DsrP) [Magnetospirillum sp. XM-1]
MSTTTTYTQVRPYTRGWLALMAGLGAVILVALGAVFHMEHQGHWVTGMTNQVVWGVPHVFAVFLIVAASGALNVASMGSVFGRGDYQPLGRLSALLAVALLGGGLAVLVLDLGRPDRLFVAMTHFNFKSIFAWNVILYSGFMAVVGVYLWTMMDWRAKRFYKPAALAAFLWRLVLTTGTGCIFGFLAAREAYGAAVMAPLFIAMSFAYGLAAFILVLSVSFKMTRRPLGDDLSARLVRLLGLFVAANLYFTALHHVTQLYFAGRGGVEAFILWNGGLHTTLFWVGQVGLGGIAPLAIAYGGCGHAARKRAMMASILVVLGGLAQVWVIIIGGQVWPLDLFPGMEASSTFADGHVHAYAPSAWEVMLGLGGMAIALAIATLGMTALRLLPQQLGTTTESGCRHN